MYTMYAYMRLLIANLVLLSLFSCSNEADEEINYDPFSITGEWVWVRSFGGFGGWTLTPASEGRTQYLHIDDLMYREYVNDSLVLEMEYDLSDYEDGNTEEGRIIMHFTLESTREQLLIIESNQLEFIDLCSDCYRYTYERN